MPVTRTRVSGLDWLALRCDIQKQQLDRELKFARGTLVVDPGQQAARPPPRLVPLRQVLL